MADEAIHLLLVVPHLAGADEADAGEGLAVPRDRHRETDPVRRDLAARQRVTGFANIFDLRTEFVPVAGAQHP